MRRLAAVLSVFILASCSDSPNAPTTTVTLLTNSFEPAEVRITPGSVVTWVNGAAIEHTITPISHSQWEEQTMTTSGQRFSVQFDALGNYEYECNVHPVMKGRIIVTNNP